MIKIKRRKEKYIDGELYRLCTCGLCNNYFKVKKYYQEQKYVCGHGTKGKIGNDSEETRFKKGLSRRGKITSEEHKRKIGEANKISLLGNTPWNKGKVGLYSDGYIDKLRNSHKGKTGHWKNKQRDAQTKEKISNKVLKLWENEKYIEAHSGRNNPNWKEVKINISYSENWTETLREAIRQRDDYMCQICLTTQDKLSRKLAIHHIDYNKKNSNPDNLISLCTSCHMKTNGSLKKKESWISFFNGRNKIMETING